MAKIIISAAEALQLAESALLRLGMNDTDSRVTADHLVEAEIRGYPGHGLRRLLGIATLGQLGHKPNQINRAGSSFLFADCNRRLGIPGVTDALNVACEGLEHSGALVLAASNYVGTTGSLGILGTALARRGVVSIIMCSSDFAVAPYGSKRAVLGTNPIAITFPGSPTQFCADLATAAWSYGALKDAADAGREVPLGIVQTHEGLPSTDPNDADNGSQLPMAGHKGYALGLAVELLCGPLLGGKAGRDAVLGSDGFFAVLVKVDAFRPVEDVNRDAQALFDEVRRGPPIDVRKPVRIPGERSSCSIDISVDEGLLHSIDLIGRN